MTNLLDEIEPLLTEGDLQVNQRLEATAADLEAALGPEVLRLLQTTPGLLG